jgi:hypothetical protein
MAFNIIGDDIQSLSLEQLTMNYNEDRDTNKVTAWRDMLQVRPELGSINLCFSLRNQKNNSIF